jgi:hypothetical protein
LAFEPGEIGFCQKFIPVIPFKYPALFRSKALLCRFHDFPVSGLIDPILNASRTVRLNFPTDVNNRLRRSKFAQAGAHA